MLQGDACTHPPLPLTVSAPCPADLLLVDPYCPTLRYFPAGEAADRSPLPLPTLTLADGATVAVASSLEGLAAEARRQQALAASGGVVRGEALVPGPDHALEQLCLMELDVRTFAQGEPPAWLAGRALPMLRERQWGIQLRSARCLPA